MNGLPNKTYKREVATTLLALLVVLPALGYIFMGSVAAWVVAQFFTPFVFVFAGGAFGLDSYIKQIHKSPQDKR